MKRRTSRALHLGTKSGAGLRPTPCARSSARVAATSGADAPFSASLRSCQCREQRQPSSPARVRLEKTRTNERATLGQTPVVGVVVVYLLKRSLTRCFFYCCCCVVVVVSDAVSPRSQCISTNAYDLNVQRVAEHWESRLPASPPPPPAFDDKELFVIEGSGPKTAGTQPLTGEC